MDAAFPIEQTASSSSAKTGSSGRSSRSVGDQSFAFGEVFAREVVRNQSVTSRTAPTGKSTARQATASSAQKSTYAETFLSSKPATQESGITDKSDVDSTSVIIAAEIASSQQAVAQTAAKPLPEKEETESGSTLESAEWLVQTNLEVASTATAVVQTDIPPEEVNALTGSPPEQEIPDPAALLQQNVEPARLAEAQTQEEWNALAWGIINGEEGEASSNQIAASLVDGVSTTTDESAALTVAAPDEETLTSPVAKPSAEKQTDAHAAFERLLNNLTNARSGEQSKVSETQTSVTGTPNDKQTSGVPNDSKDAGAFIEGMKIQSEGSAGENSQTSEAGQENSSGKAQSGSGANSAVQAENTKSHSAHRTDNAFTAEVVDMKNTAQTGAAPLSNGKSDVNAAAAAAFKAASENADQTLDAMTSDSATTGKPTLETESTTNVEHNANFVSSSAARAIDHADRTAEAQTTQRILTQTLSKLEEMTHTGQKTLRIQLHPENLGTLELRLTSQNGSLQVTILAESSLTQEALQRHAADLQQALIHSGVNLSGLSVGQRDASQQNTAGDSNAANGRRSRSSSVTLEEETELSSESVAETYEYQNPYSSLDYRV